MAAMEVRKDSCADGIKGNTTSNDLWQFSIESRENKKAFLAGAQTVDEEDTTPDAQPDFDFNFSPLPPITSDSSSSSNIRSPAIQEPFNPLYALTYKPYHPSSSLPKLAPSEQTIAIHCHDSPIPFILPLAPLVKHSRLFALLAQDPSNLSPTTTSSHGPSTEVAMANIPIDLSAEAFRPFARWLTGKDLHIPAPGADDEGFATDVYTLMHAHATGELLMAPVFTDVAMDAIIEELTAREPAIDNRGRGLRCEGGGLVELENDFATGSDVDICLSSSSSSSSSTSSSADLAATMDVAHRDREAKARDIDILLPAASAIWPAGSLGRSFIVDLWAHSAPHHFTPLTKELLLGEGVDGDFVASVLIAADLRRRMTANAEEGLGGVRSGLVMDRGWEAEPPWVQDPCRYHVHRREGRACYRRGRGRGFVELEYIVRCGVGDADVDGETDGWVGTLFDYGQCVGERTEVDGDGY